MARHGVTRTRALADSITASILTMISSLVFMLSIPFIPGAPAVPAMIAIILAFLAFRLPGYSDTFLALIVFFSIAWQFLAFVLPSSPSASGVNWQALWISVSVILVILILNMLSGIYEPLAVASASLSAALLLTPYYYLAPVFVVMPSLVRGVRSIIPTAYAFISTSIPLVILENAIRSSEGYKGLPVLFTQLSGLGGSIRPPISSFNIFVTGIPHDLLYKDSDKVLQYLVGGGVLQLIVPLICLSLSFVLSVTTVRITLWLFDRLPVFENRENLKRIIRPPVISVTAVGAFILLLTIFSPGSIGGYVSGYLESQGHIVYALAGSVLIGAAFSAREAVLAVFEDIERARDRLRELLEKINSGYQTAYTTIKAVSSKIPSIDFSSELRVLEEVRSAASDASARLTIGKRTLVVEAIDRLGNKYLQIVLDAPQRIRGRVVEEMLRIDSASKRGNLSLRSSMVRGLSLPTLGDISGAGGVEDLLKIYEEYIASVRASVSALYDLYLRSVSSYNRLFGAELVSQPPDHLNPISLLNSGNYAEAIELVTGLWRSFQENYGGRLASSCRELLDAISRFERVVRSDPERLRLLSSSIEDSCGGVGGIIALEKILEELRHMLYDEVERAARDLRRVAKIESMLGRLDPSVLRGLELRSPKMASEIEGLMRDLSRSQGTVQETVSLIERAREILWSHILSLREDESKLPILSQYPLARVVIDRYVRLRGSVSLEELPFTPAACELYARIYSGSSKNIVYKEDEAVIKISEK